MKRLNVSIIDPIITTPSFGCFNKLVNTFDHKFTMHVPSLYGMKTLEKEENPDCYVCFGSNSNIEDEQEWHDTLAKFLDGKLKQGIPVFAICFGHQLMGHYYGLKIDLVTEEKDHRLGICETTFLSDKLGFSKGQKLNLLMAHYYEVKNLNDQFEHFLKRDDCEIDGLAHKTLPLFTIQGHPEGSDFFIDEEFEELSIHPKRSLCEKTMKDGYSLLNGFFDFVGSHH